MTTYFHNVNLASDPEVSILSINTGELVPGSEVLEAFFEIKGTKVGETFTFDGWEYNTYTRTTRETRVGDVEFLTPNSNESDDSYLPRIVVDGTALEINTTPFVCRRYLIQNIAFAINSIQSIINTLNNNGWNLKLCVDPTVMLSEETLAKLPEQAAIFGCDADMDIYNRVADIAKIDAKVHPFRYTGGHIHNSFGATGIGSTGWMSDEVSTKERRMEFFAENMYRLTTLYDRLIGIASTVVNTSPLEAMRRQVYGQAGRVRLQPYGGIEYRTPSSSWLLDSSLVSYTFFWAQVANNVIFQPRLEAQINSLYAIEDIVTVINTGDSDTALEILINTHAIIKEAHGLSLMNVHKKDDILKYAQYIHENGGSHVVFDPDDTANRWNRRGFLPAYSLLPDVGNFVASISH